MEEHTLKHTLNVIAPTWISNNLALSLELDLGFDLKFGLKCELGLNLEFQTVAQTSNMKQIECAHVE